MNGPGNLAFSHAESKYFDRKVFCDLFSQTINHRLIAMMRAYFDDSGTHTDGRSKMVTCGGVVVFDEQHDRMKQEWETILNRKGLPFFHFTKFKAHRVPPYSNMSEGEREILLYQLLLAIRVRVRFCFAGTMPVSVYEHTLTAEEKERYGTAFTWAAQLTWNMLHSWAEKNQYLDPIPFVAEAGATKKGDEELRDIFNQCFADPIVKERLRLHTLTEGGKVDFVGLQAADIIANSLFEIHSRIIVNGELAQNRRISWLSKEVQEVDRLLHDYVRVQAVVFDAEELRSQVDKLNEHYRAIGKIA